MHKKTIMSHFKCLEYIQNVILDYNEQYILNLIADSADISVFINGEESCVDLLYSDNVKKLQFDDLSIVSQKDNIIKIKMSSTICELINNKYSSAKVVDQILVGFKKNGNIAIIKQVRVYAKSANIANITNIANIVNITNINDNYKQFAMLNKLLNILHSNNKLVTDQFNNIDSDVSYILYYPEEVSIGDSDIKNIIDMYQKVCSECYRIYSSNISISDIDINHVCNTYNIIVNFDINNDMGEEYNLRNYLSLYINNDISELNGSFKHNCKSYIKPPKKDYESNGNEPNNNDDTIEKELIWPDD